MREQSNISGGTRIPEIILKILKSRGIGEEMQEEFFSPRPRLAYDPFLLANMQEGVDKLLSAIDRGKRIVIYGDYDVDGITATSLLMKVIGALTDNVTYYIPSRLDEGYGLHRESIDRIAEDGGELIITVDCGSVSGAETAYAHSLGIDTLVTDHHNVSDVRAEGIIINPKLSEDEYPFKGLAGVGVAYKLALAVARVRQVPKSIMAEVLELVTIGTVADIMPMLGENRTIVKCGLRSIHLGCRNIGLRRLIDLSGLDYSNFCDFIQKTLVRRIILCYNIGAVSPLFCQYLTERKDDAYEKGLAVLDEELEKGDFVTVEINDSHEGVLGIVAGKLREKVNRPVVIISRNNDIYKGTGRSIPTVDLFSMLDKYRDDFISFGGHSAACGFTISADKAKTLRLRLNEDIEEMLEHDGSIFDFDYGYDAAVSTDEVTLGLAQAVRMLEPCGKDNEVPVFAIKNAEISGWRFLRNENKMARFTVSSDGCSGVDCLLFHDAGEVYDSISADGRADILGTAEINNWRDEEKVQIIARYVLPAGTLK